MGNYPHSGRAITLASTGQLGQERDQSGELIIMNLFKMGSKYPEEFQEAGLAGDSGVIGN